MQAQQPHTARFSHHTPRQPQVAPCSKPPPAYPPVAPRVSRVRVVQVPQNRRGVPWHRSDSKRYGFTLVDLGRELYDFARYIGLTREETAERAAIVARVSAIAKATFGPEACCEVFGSFKFGLSLPSSDVDVALVLPEGQRDSYAALERLYHVLRDEHNDTFSVHAILDARVPLLKLEDLASGVPIDVSVATDQTRPSVSSQLDFLDAYPLARPLIMCLKALLRQWGLNSVLDGGLSSTALYLIVERYLSAVLRLPRLPLPPRSSTTHTDDRHGTDAVPSGPSTKDSDYRTTASPSHECTSDSTASTPTEKHFERHTTTAMAWLGLLRHSSSDIFSHGFCVYDRLDCMNEVSRRTTRTLEIQAYMQHTANVLQTLLRAQRRAPHMPPTLLTAVAADIRQPLASMATVPMAQTVPSAEAGVSIRVGGQQVA